MLKETLTIRADEAEMEELRNRAKSREWTLSHLVRKILREWLEKGKK